MNEYFHFKKFLVSHKRSSMKVGTDGVLLGAWVDVADVENILDIGTGTGVVALMMAQRTNPNVFIDGVELNHQAAEDAEENFKNSSWQKRIQLHHTSIQSFNPGHRYNLIVSNPPFFQNSYKPPDKNRLAARHSESLPFKDLLQAIQRLLKPSGRFALILPEVESRTFKSLATNNKFYCIRECAFRSRAHKPIERILMEFASFPRNVDNQSLCLYREDDTWTEEYRSLIADFYLKG